MRTISITLDDMHQMYTKTIEHKSSDLSDGLCIDFFVDKKTYKDSELLLIVSTLSTHLVWLKYENGRFIIDLSKLKQVYSELFTGNCNWMTGSIKLKPEIEELWDDSSKKSITFCATYEQLINNMPQRIFLSHKGANKDLVREYYILFKELGLDPWYDEEDMAAGTDPYRGILQGFKESCAVIFFITPHFKDERFLSTEITYAVKEYTNRPEFKIITLQFKDKESDQMGVIPELLETYIWKTPKTDLEAMREIIKALPIKLGVPFRKN